MCEGSTFPSIQTSTFVLNTLRLGQDLSFSRLYSFGNPILFNIDRSHPSPMSTHRHSQILLICDNTELEKDIHFGLDMWK